MLQLRKCFGIFIRLIPFILMVIAYFVSREQAAGEAYIKCLPIMCLIAFVGVQCTEMEEPDMWYARVIIAGLIFCGIGDALLVCPDLFEGGMLAFGVGHLCYIFAFGFRPLAWIMGICAFAFATGVLIYLGPSLEGIELGAVPIYVYIIITMVWRACARLMKKQDWSLSKLITAFGAVLFATSDLLIALDRFKMELYYATELIMTTYYGAQLFIALSVIEPRPPTKRIRMCCTEIWCI